MNINSFKKFIVPILLCLAVFMLCSFSRQNKKLNSDAIREKISQVETSLLPAIAINDLPILKRHLSRQMKKYGVPAVSIAVINDGKLEWARAYGVIEANTNREINTATSFQAGSINKPIAAFGALALVQNKTLELNEDINKKLSSWKTPESPFTKHNAVTLKHLLNHTSGFNGIGFAGYKANEPIPSLLEILNGVRPANNFPLQITFTPGKKVAYSGGGYCVMQQLIEEAAQLSFADFMERTVFRPLSMTHSTMRFPFLDNGNTAHAHSADGKPMSGGFKTYPESAAAGLWSTPADIAKWLIHIQNSLLGQEQHMVLNQETLHQMITPDITPFGLGPLVNGEGNTLNISHKGFNDGFTCEFIAYPYLGKGAVVMTNSNNGICLVDEILRSIAFVYQWPSYQPEHKNSLPLTSEDLRKHIGRYGTDPQKNDSNDVFVSEKQGELFLHFGCADIPYKLYKEKENKFFLIESGFEILFKKHEQSKTLTIITQEGFERTFTLFD
ncbi:MAG: hypothetical protein Tsb0015_03160 [Simkaniaceae bacterium]